MEGEEEVVEVEERDEEVEERRSPGARRGEGVMKVKGESVRFNRGVTGRSTRWEGTNRSKKRRAGSASGTLKGCRSD